MTGFCGRLWPNFAADRRRPPLAALAAEEDPERFVWRVLPHAARTFAPAIAVLPARLARPLAAAYLWCRALDTLEDLSPDAATRRAGFAACVAAAEGTGNPAVPPTPLVQDDRDRAHWLIVEKSALLGRYTAALGPDVRARLATLVREMAAGMDLAAERRAAADGVLAEGAPREEYCRAVLAGPLVYAESELRAQGGDPPLDDGRFALAMAAGEIIQLANVCRDVEKDLARGVAYDTLLRPWLAARAAPPDVVAEVRRRVLLRAAELGPAVGPYFSGLPLRGRPGARAAAAIMCGATASFYRRVDLRLPRRTLGDPGPCGRAALGGAAFRAAASLAGATAVFARFARVFAPAALEPAAGPVECRRS